MNGTCPQTESAGVKVETVESSFLKLRGEIRGPPDTPFEGNISSSTFYTFKITILKATFTTTAQDSPDPGALNHY